MSLAHVEPMDPAITSIQPGGGFCIRVELAWGALRRRYLKTFRRRYLQRMARLREGSTDGCPHEVLDPRDLKFYRNQCTCRWRPEDDPFRWRERLPFARVGLAELTLSGLALLLLAVGAWQLHPAAAAIPLSLILFIAWFFRNPQRVVPTEMGAVVSPADGRVVAIEELDYDEYLQGPALMIGIFLNVFNVHINRAPCGCRVIGLHYRRGKFLNALRPESARENEQLAVRLQETAAPYRRMVVRQIAGAIARRIVCWVAPGEELARGEQFGMIKLGSRTELVLPKAESLSLAVRLGDRVSAGSTILARYGSSEAGVESSEPNSARP